MLRFSFVNLQHLFTLLSVYWSVFVNRIYWLEFFFIPVKSVFAIRLQCIILRHTTGDFSKASVFDSVTTERQREIYNFRGVLSRPANSFATWGER